MVVCSKFFLVFQIKKPKINFLFALICPRFFSSDVCEEIELANATVVYCDRNTTFRVGQVNVSFVPYQSPICPVEDRGL